MSTLSVEIQAPGFLKTTLRELTKLERIDDRLVAEVSLSRGASLRGSARTRAGDKVVGAVIKIRKRNARRRDERVVTSDAEGRYVSKGFEQGDYEIEASAGKLIAKRRVLSLTREEVKDFDLVCTQGRTLELILVDQEDRPLTGVPVSLASIRQASPSSGMSMGESSSALKSKSDGKGRWRSPGLSFNKSRFTLYFGSEVAMISKVEKLEESTEYMRLRVKVQREDPNSQSQSIVASTRVIFPE